MSQIGRFCNQNEHVLRDLPELGFQGAPEGPRKIKTALFAAWRDEKFPQAHPNKPQKVIFHRVAYGNNTNPALGCPWLLLYGFLIRFLIYTIQFMLLAVLAAPVLIPYWILNRNNTPPAPDCHGCFVLIP